MTALFYEDITAFMELIRKQRFEEAEKEMKRKRREVGQAKKRIAELDRIFKRIYEDDISGTISHERFLKLSAEYEAEQRELTEKVKAEQKEVDTYEQDRNDFDSFAAIIRKYVEITELTPTIVNEFIKKIVVYAPEKVNGKRRHSPCYGATPPNRKLLPCDRKPLIFRGFLEFTCVCCFLNRYSICYCHTNHRVVTCTNKTHHFNVSWYR